MTDAWIDDDEAAWNPAPSDPDADLWQGIRDTWSRGFTVREVAEAFGVSRSTISRRSIKEKWRRQDDRSEPFDPQVDPMDPQDRSRLALLRLDHAILSGAANAAATWMRLYDRCRALAEPAAPPPPPPPPKGPDADDLITDHARQISRLIRHSAVADVEDIPLIKTQIEALDLQARLVEARLAGVGQDGTSPDLVPAESTEISGLSPWDMGQAPLSPPEEERGAPQKTPPSEADPAVRSPVEHSAAPERGAPAPRPPSPADAGQPFSDPAAAAARARIADMYAQKRSRIKHRLGYNDLLRDLRLAGADPHLMEPPEE